MIKRYILSAICFHYDEPPACSGIASQNDPGELILSVNALSFNDLLSARERTCNEQVYTLLNLIDWCASQEIKLWMPLPTISRLILRSRLMSILKDKRKPNRPALQ
jgi:hypothetical protein